MAYRAGSPSNRDQIYPSEIAQQRPKFATRVECSDDFEEMDSQNSISGPESGEGEDRVTLMNRQLRGQPLRGERE